MINFPDELLSALGAWQKGWREDDSLRLQLADQLREATRHLPRSFRTVVGPCYRKRFLHRGELAALFLADARDEGVVSWTKDRRFAECFKGLHRPDAVSGAIFRHEPLSEEVVVDITALWDEADFRAAVTAYRERNGENGAALVNFAASQGEVVLHAPLRASEIVALTGASSPFDTICDQMGVPQTDRDRIFRGLVAEGVYPGDHQYISDHAAQRVVSRTLAAFNMERLRREGIG